ncbi:MAG: tRNA dihydrouridine synthase DusB, partial [Caldimonas sp.]
HGWLVEHLHDHYSLYGEWSGVRTARKHIGWYVRGLPGGETLRRHINTLESCDAQISALNQYFEALSQRHVHLPDAPARQDEPFETEVA